MARTREEIEAQVAEIIQKAQGGFVDGGKKTVREYFAEWLPAVEPTLRPSTARKYSDAARLHIVENIGNVRLSKLTPGDIQGLYSNRLAAGLSPTTVHHLHAILHRALDQAVKWGYVMRNVADAVDPPRRNKPEMRVWSREEATRVLQVAAGDEYEALWYLALTTGMRRGELLGLRWSDVDLDARTLSVARTLSRGKTSRLEVGEPKTAAGRRRVALPAAAVLRLRRHQTRQKSVWLEVGPAYADRNLVFATPDGRPIHPNTLARGFTRLVNRAEVGKIRFHDLRHTSATLLLASGEHPKVVQERLGHASISETLDRYSHVSADMQQRAAARFDAMFDEATGTE
jgi:integrase